MRRLALLALAAPLLWATPAWGQDPATSSPAPMAGHAHAMGAATGAGEMCGGEGCACKAMMAKMDSADARLASLTETMNKASGGKKTEAMAAVVNALVADRLAMQGMMQEMHKHMMGMMQGGMGGMGGMHDMKGMAGGKAGCPAGMACGATTPAPADPPKE